MTRAHRLYTPTRIVWLIARNGAVCALLLITTEGVLSYGLLLRDVITLLARTPGPSQARTASPVRSLPYADVACALGKPSAAAAHMAVSRALVRLVEEMSRASAPAADTPHDA